MAAGISPIEPTGCSMRLSLDWLGEFVDLKGQAPEDLVEALNHLGMPASSQRTGENDRGTAIDLSLPWCRPDWYSYAGIARELATKLSLPTPNPQTIAGRQRYFKKSALKIDVNDTTLCHQYLVFTMETALPPRLPDDVAKRLRTAGVAVSTVPAAIATYVTMTTGQSIQIYDADKVAGALRIRGASIQDQLPVGGGKLVPAQLGDIVVCDQTGIIALAAFSAAERVAVTSNTKRLLVELANFNAANIMRTAQRLGLQTPASLRCRLQEEGMFEAAATIFSDLLLQGSLPPAPPPWRRPTLPAMASLRPLGIHQAGGRTTATSTNRDFPPPPRLPRIALRLRRVQEMTGMAIGRQQLINILIGLGCRYLDGNDSRLVFEIPQRRLDLTREIDLIAEAARLHGFHSLPAHLPNLARSEDVPGITTISYPLIFRQACANAGLTEVLAKTWACRQDTRQLGILSATPFDPQCGPADLTIAQELPDDSQALATTLLTSLLPELRSQRANQKSTEKSTESFAGAGFFSTSTVYFPPDGRKIRENATLRDLQNLLQGPQSRLGILLELPVLKEEESIAKGRERDTAMAAPASGPLPSPAAFHRAAVEFKAAAESLLAILMPVCSQSLRFRHPTPGESSTLAFLNPCQTLIIEDADSVSIGWCGRIHPHAAFKAGLGLKAIPCYLEISMLH